MEPLIIVVSDKGVDFRLRVIPDEYRMDFEVFSVLRGAENQVKLRGFLLYDGCMNFEGNGMIHLCGPETVKWLSCVLLKIYEIGPQHIEHWCG
jgi:hypothetical protein